MFVLRMKKWGTLALAGTMLAGCGNSGPSEEQLFAKYKLNEADQSAFKACENTMGKVQPILQVSNKDQMMKSVPSELCACQAKTMSMVFKEDEYFSFSSFANYLGKVEKKKLPRLAKQDLKPGVASESAVRRLTKTFESCALKYLADNKDSDELIGFLLPPPEPRKSAKEKKEELKKEKAKQASAT